MLCLRLGDNQVLLLWRNKHALLFSVAVIGVDFERGWLLVEYG
jgi:hypothetical protein